jgi:hypothetical protein
VRSLIKKYRKKQERNDANDTVIVSAKATASNKTTKRLKFIFPPQNLRLIAS